VNDYGKGVVFALGRKTVPSVWQPQPSTGYGIQQNQIPITLHTNVFEGLQLLEPAHTFDVTAHGELTSCCLQRGTGGRHQGEFYDVERKHDVDRPRNAAKGSNTDPTRCVYSG